MSALPFIYDRPGHPRHNQPIEADFPAWTDSLCTIRFADGHTMVSSASMVMPNPDADYRPTANFRGMIDGSAPDQKLLEP